MSETITTDDGVKLHLYEWLAKTPKLTVVLLHGYGEHAGRYAHVAEAFVARDISVIAADLRGHGKSEGRRGYITGISNYHLDAEALLRHAKSKAEKLALLGHSMGGLIAAHWMITSPKDFVGMMLSSPFLGLHESTKGYEIAAGKLLSKILPKVSLSVPHKGKDVCTDPDFGALYDSDPLNNKGANALWFTSVLEAMRTVHGRAGELRLPTLLLYGGADRIVSVSATDRFAEALAMEDKTVERLEGYFHEIVNEAKPARDEVIARIGDWLLSHAEEK